jgi:hypothetical protein
MLSPPSPPLSPPLPSHFRTRSLPLCGSGIEEGERAGERGERGWQRERAEKRERVREGEIEGGWLGRSCWILMLPYMRN